jgi:hypothetical protein
VVFPSLSLSPTALQALAPPPLDFLATARASEPVYACGVSDAGGQNNIFQSSEAFGIPILHDCASGGGIFITDDDVNTVPNGAVSKVVATAPPGFAIIGANVPQMSVGSDTTGTGFVANFIWTGASPYRVTGGHSFGVPVGGMDSAQFGFELDCAPSPPSPCKPRASAIITVSDVQLTVAETVPPSITANGSTNLWYKGSSEYVRGGGWSAAYWAGGAPSGIASMSATINGQAVLPAPNPCNPNHTVWQQCPASQTWSPTVALSGSGDQQLVLSATSAAGNTTPATETIHVDSQQPMVSLNGPTQASSTAGTQYVTATAAVGPSGLGAISCSVDGGAAQSYSSSPASVPVSGLGVHSVQCTATNRSYDSTGAPASSAPATWSLDIRQPAVSLATFSVIRGLRCGKVRELEKIPAHLVRVRRHRHLVWVRRRARTIVRRVERCHVRVVTKRICHAGHCQRQRTAKPPQVVNESTRRVHYGKGTTVSGWIGTTDGVALGAQHVRILTAPDNGSNALTQAATVTTGPDGTWSVRLRGGPSRLVQAVYDGTSTTEPASSAPITLLVPAEVKIRIRPRSTRWGGTITIMGRVLGGYIPAGKLLRLRIGIAGVRGTVGIPNVRPNGRFETTWTFSAGRGVVHYWFSVSTLSEADYPFAPASSRRVYVRVGSG